MNDSTRIRLLSLYPAREEGTWRILGEDPNCDYNAVVKERDWLRTLQSKKDKKIHQLQQLLNNQDLVNDNS